MKKTLKFLFSDASNRVRLCYVIFTAQFSYNFLFESYIYPETKAYDI